MNFRTLDQAEVNKKRVLLRVDLNVPMADGRVTDRTRIERIVPTITEIGDKGGKAILLSHLGRPKEPNPKDSLRPVAAVVAEIIGRPVAFGRRRFLLSRRCNHPQKRQAGRRPRRLQPRPA